MKLSLYQKLALGLLAVFILFIVLFYFWTNKLELDIRLQAEQKLHQNLAANLVNDNPLLQQGATDYQALSNLFHTLMVLGPAFEFYLLDKQGNLQTYSAPEEKIKRHKVSLLPIQKMLSGELHSPIFGDDPRSETGQKIFSVAEVVKQNKVIGYLYVIVTGERYTSLFAQLKQDSSLQTLAISVLLALSFLFIVMLALFKNVTQPVCQLSDQMLALKKNNFDLKNSEIANKYQNKTDEVSLLGQVCHQLVVQVNEQFSRLTELDQQRRTLLSELSHDLRTPLASLKGYAETLAFKSAQLSEAQHQQFIQVILKHTDQLKNLIDQIFELAHLESGEVTLTMEQFNLPELLYDVMQKFQMAAQQRNVQLSVVGQSQAIIVHSDIAKVERVLTNLIDNAMRHTPENGKIDIVFEVHANQCQVKVRDTGNGIKEAELEYIFNAHYRASNKQENGQRHIGLGLTISKKLLALLNSNIQVESELGKGTEFSFQLQLAS